MKFSSSNSRRVDIETWNAAIEAAALIVEPNPHVEEERECQSIAKEIRSLKKNFLE